MKQVLFSLYNQAHFKLLLTKSPKTNWAQGTVLENQHSCIVRPDQQLSKQFQNVICGAQIEKHSERKLRISPQQNMIQIVHSYKKLNSSVRILYPDIITIDELTDGQKNRIASVLCLQSFIKNQVIVSQGDPAQSFYIIKEGEVGIFQNDVLIRTLSENESFGEQSLLQENQFRQMTAKAMSDNTKLLGLGRQIITQILGDQVENIIYRNIFKWTLKKSRLGRLPKISFDKVLERLTFMKMNRGDTIIEEGEEMGKLYLVIINNKGLILEQDTVLDQNIGKKHCKTVRMIDDGILGFIDINKIRSQVGSLEDIVKKYEFQQQLFNEEIQILKESKLEDYLFLQKLGAGQFGQVYLIKLPKINKIYALKCVTKYHIEKFRIQKHIQQEKQILELMDHQFVMKFLRSFKDDKSVYFLTEFIAGIELFDAIREIGLLDTRQTQFYISQMIEQLEYIHKKHIIYRDLKPENIMLDADGYLKLIDMGTAKSLLEGNKIKSKVFTIIGTPHYMAPEVIQGKGYNAMADIWSLGVCFYEFMCGSLPFAEDEENPYEIYKIIQNTQLEYPKFVQDVEAKRLIRQLLDKTPEVRNGGSYQALKQDQWFKNFDWLKLDQRLLEVPLKIPKQKVYSDSRIKALEKSAIRLVDQIRMDHIKMKVPSIKKKIEWDQIF